MIPLTLLFQLWFSFLDLSCGCQFSSTLFLRPSEWWQASANSNEAGTSIEPTCANRGVFVVLIWEWIRSLEGGTMVSSISTLLAGIGSFRQGIAIENGVMSKQGGGRLNWTQGRLPLVLQQRERSQILGGNRSPVWFALFQPNTSFEHDMRFHNLEAMDGSYDPN
ncbi:hypothetical protein VNO77_23017 [Canavalia gladiata]|uniref:Secreted protein n=1 Tax=Canavalia gladiata TaxID=3824 RepID=A0AAN9L555_CANGL